MAVRQYVGARYVPLLCGDWDPTRTYEPLSIVTYNFASYTSKQMVPAGTLPTDEDYWQVTGNYNQQVEQYRQEVEGLKETVHGVTSQLFSNMVHGKAKKILLIGDSWATGYGETTSYSTLLANEYDITTSARDGAGFGLANNSFLSLIPDSVSVYSDVWFLGGTNETNSNTTNVLNGISACVQKVRDTNEKCNIYIGYLGRQEYVQWAGVYKRGCLENGVYYIENMKNINYRYDYYTSSNHPAQQLQREIYLHLKEFIETNNITLDTDYVTSQISFRDSYTGVTGGQIKVQVVGENKVITVGSITITGGAKRGENNLGPHNNPLIGQNGKLYIPCTCIYMNPDQKIVSAAMYFGPNDIYLNLYADSELPLTKTVTGITTAVAPISYI